ncbi:hypothetical protein DYI23_06940 [Roseibium polysiphoniae]|uniref:Uncharacterized protein n=1 Tax=Roseibium polysiphoniae TaxID=2571221 RepID=A0A944CD54_9HYPH|nr:hypothetical protein [Roseibium polysiphoniae]MBS8259951.1 hypothetical protein [Roseibium polysiphoniae]
MFRPLLALLAAVLLALTTGHSPAWSEARKKDVAVGDFKIVNTGGFVEEDGIRRSLATDTTMGTVKLSRVPGTNDILLKIGGSSIELFSMEKGLATFFWNPEDTNLLHGNDILNLSAKNSLEDVSAWAARIDWPDLGKVTLVLFNYDPGSYGGFLISNPPEKTVVRQMEFHQLHGPRHRADNLFNYNRPEHRR